MELLQISNKAQVDQSLDFSDYIALFQTAAQQKEGWQWAAANIASAVTARYGEHTINRFASEVGVSHQYLRQLIKTWEVFGEFSTRVENWSFSHHKAAACYAESAFEAQAALRSLRPNASVRELEAELLQASGKTRPMRLVPADRETQAVLDEQKEVNPGMTDAQAIREIVLKHTGKITCRLEASPEIKGAITVISDYLAEASFENCVEFALRETARRLKENGF